MKVKWTLGLIGLCVLMSGIGFAAAQDTTPEPPIENECSPGGVLYREENQDGCPTEWHWKAGWFLAAVNNGDIPREAMPDEFTSVLPPPEPTPDPTETPDELIEPAVGTCWNHVTRALSYTYLGPINTLGNFKYWTFDDCRYGGINHPIYQSIVLAHSQTEAEAICATLGTSNLVVPFNESAPAAPSYSYLCQIDGASS